MAETNSLSLIEINKTDNKTTKYAINEMVLAILLQYIPVNFGGVSRAQNALTLLTDRIILAFYKAKLDAQANGINDKITVWLEHFQGNNVDEQYNFLPATYLLNELVPRPAEISIELTEAEWQKIISVIPKTGRTGRTQPQLFADQIKLVSTAVLECYKKLDAKLDAGQKLAVDAKKKAIILDKVNNNDAIAAAAAVNAAAGAAFEGPANIRVDFINSGIVYAALAIAAAGAAAAAVAAEADTTLANELGVTPFAVTGAGSKPANWNFKMWCSLLVKIAIDGVTASSTPNLVEEVIDIKYTPGYPNETKSLLFDKFNKDDNGAKIKTFWKDYLLTVESKLTGGKGTKRRRRRNRNSKKNGRYSKRRGRKSRRRKSRRIRRRSHRK